MSLRPTPLLKNQRWYARPVASMRTLREKVKNDIMAKPSAGFLLLGYFLLIWYVFSIVPALLLLVGLAFLVYRWEVRVLIVTTGILLLAMALLALFDQIEWTRSMAMYAFFFLIIWLVSRLFLFSSDDP